MSPTRWDVGSTSSSGRGRRCPSCFAEIVSTGRVPSYHYSAFKTLLPVPKLLLELLLKLRMPVGSSMPPGHTRGLALEPCAWLCCVAVRTILQAALMAPSCEACHARFVWSPINRQYEFVRCAICDEDSLWFTARGTNSAGMNEENYQNLRAIKSHLYIDARSRQRNITRAFRLAPGRRATSLESNARPVGR